MTSKQLAKQHVLVLVFNYNFIYSQGTLWEYLMYSNIWGVLYFIDQRKMKDKFEPHQDLNWECKGQLLNAAGILSDSLMILPIC